MQSNSTSQRGFTILEMSIVLVVIGLIIGGVLMGQSLIQQAQMRSLIKQIEQYKTAVMTFRDKYAALPGDIANATTFWPADAACTGSHRPSMTTPNGMTCNGDGNAILYWYEQQLFWQHLSLAGLIQDGPFTGSYDNNGSNQTNSPTYAMHPGMGVIGVTNPDIDSPNSSYPNWFVQQGGQHVFWLGGWSGTDGSGNPLWGSWPSPALTRGELKALDTKYDDGLRLRSYHRRICRDQRQWTH
ncbi:MAG: prepilin-type N-terminal cleavage/methylation domain-containing protein [Deltaproteobacteria bacterium]|nr:prepilin-type N-terminal cleavage/methylation domain-containing protein [Deltaproteobacteria bacterium]